MGTDFQMRIAVDTRPIGPGMTGIGGYAAALLRGLRSVDGRGEIVCVTAGREETGPAETQRFPCLSGDGSFLWEQIRLPGELEETEVDLFHSPFIGVPVVNHPPSVLTIDDVIPENGVPWSEPGRPYVARNDTQCHGAQPQTGQALTL